MRDSNLHIDLEALELAAVKATPGPWRLVDDWYSGEKHYMVVGPNNAPLFDSVNRSPAADVATEEPDMRFAAAANPATVLELIRQVRESGTHIAAAIHYPECWDTMAYPTLEEALAEMFGSFQCSNDQCARLSVTTPTGVPDGYMQGVEAVAKMLEKKVEDYAVEYGYDDMGSLSFGRGEHGHRRSEYHSDLLGHAEEVRAMLPVSPSAPSGLPELLQRHVDFCMNQSKGLVERAYNDAPDVALQGALGAALQWWMRTPELLSAATAAPADAVAKDAAMLNFLSRPGIEIGTESDEGELAHIVYEVVGSINDREWRELGRGATLRAAINTAIQGKESS